MQEEYQYGIKPKDTNPMPGGCGYSALLYDKVQALCVSPPSHNSIIELGCGTGGNLSLFVGARHRVGIDPLQENINVASNREGVAAICGNHDELVTFAENEFDVGFTLSVLNHIGGVDAVTSAIGEMLRICKQVLFIEPYKAGVERQFVRGEIKRYDTTWLHDYRAIISGLGYVPQVKHCPLYQSNSGRFYHTIYVYNEAKVWTQQYFCSHCAQRISEPINNSCPKCRRQFSAYRQEDIFSLTICE